MRVNLRVTFDEKDKVKQLGAKWDAARKVWFVFGVDDLTPFSQWIPAIKHWDEHKSVKKKKTRALSKNHGKTISAFTKISCQCTSPPWEHCSHSLSNC